MDIVAKVRVHASIIRLTMLRSSYRAEEMESAESRSGT